MPKTITCPYCGKTKTVRLDAETCGSGACRVKKSRELKKLKQEGENGCESTD